MTMQALKPFRYATRMLKVGDTFEPRGKYEARVLVAMKRAAHVGTPVEAPAEDPVDPADKGAEAPAEPKPSARRTRKAKASA